VIEGLAQGEIERLKARARNGDREALQRLRESGYFDKKTAGRQGFPASHAQKRLWVLDRMDDGSAAYNVPVALQLDGALDVDALRRALSLIVSRHESLRTALREVDGEPRQFVDSDITLDVAVLDFRGEPDPDAAARAEASAESARPFDLTRAPLLRTSIIKVADDRHLLLLTAHHVVFDQWSSDVFVRELAEGYRAFRAGDSPVLPALSIQYKDFAVWQNARLDEPGVEAHRAYWREKLAGPIAPLDLPSDRARPPLQTFHGGLVVTHLNDEVFRGLEALARREGASMVMAIASVVKVLSHRYTGQEDVVIGTTTAGRDRQELATQIGFYVNALALRDRIEARDSFLDVLRRVRVTATEAYEHQAYPFDRLVDDLALVRDPSRSPLFDVMLMVNDDAASALQLNQLRVSSFDYGHVAAKYDLTLDFVRAGASWSLRLIYNSDLYDRARMERFVEHLERLAAGAVQLPERPIGQLDLIGEDERRQLLAWSAGETRPYPSATSIADLFEAQVQRDPEAGAVRVPGDAGKTAIVTYGELDELANQLAARMAPLAGPDAAVAVMLGRGVELVTALLAVLKCGATYLPLDPALPIERLKFAVRDAGATVVVTDGARIPVASQLGARHILDVGEKVALETGAMAGTRSPEGRAYVIYTSGSTGVPKGVEVEHRSFINMITAQIDAFGIESSDAVLQFASCAFDASLSEIFMALLSGACLVCPSEERLKDPAELLRIVRVHGITVATLPPPYIRALGFEALRSLRTLITAGEEAEPDAGSVGAMGCWYFNAYGPTEFSVCATLGRVPAGIAAGRVPIGRPIANTETLVLTPGAPGAPGAEGLQPIGVAGEICLAGAGLARGYVGRPDLTAASFVAHPFRRGERMYRTGDLGRWREDGTVEFLGRLDHQVKIRGYRIEPGEIESAIRAQQGVSDAVVLPREGALVAYVESSEPAIEDRLRDALSRTLPEYMVPERWIALAEFPRLASGKVNRAALPAPDRHIADGSGTPTNDAQASLAAIWRDVLGLESVGIHDRFLDLGGNSMKAILMVSRVLRDLGTRLPIREVFEHGTIAALSASLGAPAGAKDDIQPLPPAADYALSHAQRRLWTIDRMGEGAGAYNIAGAIRLATAVDAEALSRALDALAARHESLRTTFVEMDGRPRQVVHDRLPLDFDVIEAPDGDADGSVRRLIEADAARPFDLANGPLFRARLFTRPGSAVFYLNIHHVISDGWSLEVFFRDLVRLMTPGTPPAALPVHYKEFAAWQNARLDSPRGAADRAYWLSVLEGELPVLDLPADRARPAVKSFKGSTVTFTVDGDLSRRFREFARARQATSVNVWLSLLYTLLHRYTDRSDLIVGVPATFREHPALEHQIGYFVNMIPLRMRIAEDETYAGLLGRIRDSLHASFEHKNYPYDLLVETLSLRRDMSRNPLFDVALSIQEQPLATGQVDAAAVEPFPFASSTSKFDLTLFASETSSGQWDVVLEYDTDLFDRWRIEHMAVHLQQLMRSAFAGGDAAIGDLDLMDAEERAQVCEEWNRTTRAYPRDAGLAELFRQVAGERPDAPAVDSGQRSMSYRELDVASDRVASEIRGHGPAPEIIPVLLRRSVNVPIALLAALKAGAAYAPLDPTFPAARLEALLADLNASVVLAEREFIGGVLSRIPNLTCVDVERVAPPGPDLSAVALAEAEGPGLRTDGVGAGGSLAYVMYTSGSTGVPKGVLVDQRSVTRLVRNTDYAAFGPGDRMLHYSAPAFDASTLEIWAPLLNGGTVCLPPAGEAPGGAEMREWLTRFRPTVMWLTASLFNQLAEFDAAMFRDVRALLTGGERLSPPHVNLVRDACPGTTVINGYGPTENTTFSLCHRIDRRYDADIPLGRPIANSRAYIVDRRLRPVPIGVPGEILVAGDGVARGYLNDVALTAARFVADPFAAGARAYRTADRGYWRPDGTVGFLGRLDDQVKVRGFRIEPGEVEAAIRSAGAGEATVVARTSSTGTQELVAHFTGDASLDASTLRERLRVTLPPYMIPSHLIAIERMPLTPSGKVDRHQLPEPERHAAPPAAAASTDREMLLAKVWGDVLGRSDLGLDSGYFDLGGDSIQAIQIASRLQREGWLLRVRDLFQHPTIRELAPMLRRVDAPAADASTTLAAIDDSPITLSPIQSWFFRRTWFFRRPTQGLHHFNQTVLLRAASPLKIESLQRALLAIWDRHAALRTTFPRHADGAVRPVVAPPGVQPVVEVVDLTAEADTRSALNAAAEAAQHDFDVASGPLARAIVYRTSDGERLFLCAHHLVVDAVSWRILLEDLEAAYGQAVLGAAIDLGPATAPYLGWVNRLDQQHRDGAFDEEREYWKTADEGPAVRLPHDLAAADPGTFGDADIVTLTLDAAETTRLLERTHRAYGARTDEVLMTAAARTLSSFTAGSRVVVTNETHGRDSEWLGVDVSRTVGWFTALYPLVVDLSEGAIEEDLKRVKEAMRRVPRNGVGYGALRYLGSGTPAPASPVASFNYLGQFGGSSNGRAHFDASSEPHGADVGADVLRAHHLEISGAIGGGTLELTIAYSRRRFARDTMNGLADRLRAELLAIVEHCDAVQAPEKTPSDFSALSWSLDEYAGFLRDTGLRREEIDDVAPLSPMQEGLLYQRRLHAASTAYHVQMDFAVRGPLDAGLYRAAWDELARRHPILRTAFLDEGLPRPLQVVLRQAPFEFTFEDVAQRPSRPDEYRAEDLRRPFDMRRAPLWRIAVFHLGTNHHRIIWSYHHILIDGWSLAILYRQLAEVYAALEAGTPPVRVPERPFTAFVRWLERTDAARAGEYWSSYLSGVDARTLLPRPSAATSETAYAFAERTFEAGDRLSAAINQTAARLGVTTYTVVQAAWSLVLSRYTGRNDVVFGSIVSGRPAALDHVDETVGLFINAVPVRVQIDRDRSFAEMARALQSSLLEQSDFHSLPLAEIQRLAPLERDLFDHLLVFENYPGVRDDVGAVDADAAALTVELFEAHDESHYDLNVVIVPGRQLQFRTSYNANVHPADWVERFVGHLFRALDQACGRTEQRVGDIDVTTGAERAQLLDGFQGLRRKSGAPLRNVVEWLTHHAQATPGASAVESGAGTLTFAELEEQSGRFAAWLVDRYGTASDRRVALLMDRSPRLIVSLLGVLKSGAAYVPIDPAYPTERVTYLLTDSAPTTVLTESRYFARVTVPGAVRIDEVWDEVMSTGRREIQSPAPDDLAYVIYTSGSTGRPKGCQIEHRNLAHYVDWAARAYFGDGPGGQFALYSSLAFDLTVTSLFLPIVLGRTLHVLPQDLEVHDALRLMLDPANTIDAIKLTPSHISLIPDLGVRRTNIATAVVGGEALHQDHVRLLRALNPTMAIFNEYGPTETTVGCIVKEMASADEPITIGKPIDDTRIHIVDGQGRLAPIGTAGEIYIAGAGVGRGYLGKPELTRERFVAEPFALAHPNAVSYRTGDAGRWLPNGEIEYLGRSDDQIKIRGHRIEPGEIEAAIAEADGRAEQALVVARRLRGSSEDVLVAYVTGQPDIAALRARLASTLPDAFVPTHFVVVERFPLTANGKIDRAALPDPDVSAAVAAPASHTPTERRVATIWQQVLGIEAVGPDDKFFSLGGHSLKATQIVSRIFRDLGVKVSLKEFFAATSVAAVAALIDGRSVSQDDERIPVAPPQQTYVLSPAQHRLWLLHQLPGGETAYNMPFALEIEGAELDTAALERALNDLIDRHESLRTAFVLVDGEPRQRVLARVDARLEVVDLRESAAAAAEASARAVADEQAHLPFQLAAPPLLRAVVLRMPPAAGRERAVLLLTVHHIVGDGWSMVVLTRELAAMYRARRMGQAASLQPMRIQYKDYAEWQQRQDWSRAEAWWMTQLEGTPDQIALPYDLAPSGERDFRGAVVDATLEPRVVDGLRALGSRRGATLAHVVLALFQLALYKWSGQSDVSVGMSVANRTQADLEGLVGFFVNLVPIRARLSEDMDLDALIDQVSTRVSEALDHDCPFDLLIRGLGRQRVANRQPLINVVYAFQRFDDLRLDREEVDAGSQPGDDSIRQYPIEFRTSKFDLTLFAADDGPGRSLKFVLEYDTGLFRKSTAERILNALCRFATAAASQREGAGPA
jgi:amino acid adenylation domain-containing protein/non-ribosomal peptide synthase protein (TIGR01720 family)